MGKKDVNFAAGALVFARVKGYAPWPAKVTKADKKKYSVYFFGTGEISTNLKPEDLFDYLENKDKFVAKNLKRKFYKEAVDQIEAALKGEEDITAINTPPPDLTEAATDATPETETLETTQEKEPEVPAKKPPKLKAEVKVNTTVSPKKDADKSLNESAPEAVEGEIVSRSGRKIKPKRFVDAEVDEVLPAAKRKATAPATPEVKDEPKLARENSTDKTFEKLMKLESNLIELDHLIKSSVGLNGAQPEKCIEHLNEYKSLEITPLMLKKHPNCVETMKRLRRYVGNVKAWEMDESLRQDFDSKAQQIRLAAEDIYNSFKKMFDFASDQTPFFEFFMERVKEFQKRTAHMTLDQIHELIEEPMDLDAENNSQ